MKAYKIWYDEKNFIHKNTTDDLNIRWTTDINEALDSDDLYPELDISSYAKACRFFNDTLGFSRNISTYDALYFL